MASSAAGFLVHSIGSRANFFFCYFNQNRLSIEMESHIDEKSVIGETRPLLGGHGQRAGGRSDDPSDDSGNRVKSHLSAALADDLVWDQTASPASPPRLPVWHHPPSSKPHGCITRAVWPMSRPAGPLEGHDQGYHVTGPARASLAILDSRPSVGRPLACLFSHLPSCYYYCLSALYVLR